jgi:hypothetical protein
MELTSLAIKFVRARISIEGNYRGDNIINLNSGRGTPATVKCANFTCQMIGLNSGRTDVHITLGADNFIAPPAAFNTYLRATKNNDDDDDAAPGINNCLFYKVDVCMYVYARAIGKPNVRPA